MKYKFETMNKDYSDFSSGRVLYNVANTTAFPVRLASELIQRAFNILEKDGARGPYKIYDPCCGGEKLDEKPKNYSEQIYFERKC